MRNILALTLALLMLLVSPALAEDVCIIDNAAAASAEVTDRSYLRVRCPLEGETNVTLTITDEWGGTVYQRSYGMCSGTFESEDMYLRLDGAQSSYTVTVQTDSAAHSFRVTREMARLTDTAVYAGGLTLRQLADGSSRKYAVILDVDALEDSTLTVPMLSDGMQLGYVTYEIEDGQLTVSASLTADGSIDKTAIYVARDAITAQTLGTNHFTGRKEKLSSTIDLSATPYAAVLVQFTVSYDPTTAQAWEADEEFTQQQLELWELMKLTTANEAVG
ncbi:MAG: hypothetical protein IJ438_00615 [Clostridia bacterium]|nr:hypothetical protein [Clostridia bacterium]